MARPRKGHEKHVSARLAFRVSPATRAALDARAAARGVAIADVMRDIIEAALADDDRATRTGGALDPASPAAS